MVKRIVAAVAALWIFGASGHAEDCRLKRLAALDIAPGGGGHIVTTLQVNGKALTFVVDTGSDHTMISQRAADLLGMKIEPFPNSNNMLWGGYMMKTLAIVDSLQIGRMVLGHSTMFVLPRDIGAGVDGLLGTDILARFDADFDFAKGKLNLVEHSPCPGKAVYWTDENAAAQIPFRKQTGVVPVTGFAINKLNVVVTLDGKEVLAILDTGAPLNTLDLETAQRAFDLRPESPGMVKLKQPEGSYSYTFKTLSFGGVVVNNPIVRLDPLSVHQMGTRGPKMLIGLDVLRQLHLYIAYRENMLYVTGATAH